MGNRWFDVDKEGLSKVVKRRGMEFVLYELLQNAWDTNAGTAEVTLTPVEGRPLVEIRVLDDDPDGFKDLSHAYTLFAESDKKVDATKRGRFNLGEKLVLAVCEHAEICSTKGTVKFEPDGTRRNTGKKREHGTEFFALVRMTRDELKEVLAATRKLLPPIETVINGETVQTRAPLCTFTVTLPTEIADAEGYLKRSARKTEVRVYERSLDQSSRLYEMGIPVVDTDDPWDIEIMQKIPLNAERDNVTPAYLREVRVHVINEMHAYLKPDDAVKPAVQEALADSRITAAAVNQILDHQFGDKRVIFDGSDREATSRSFANGYSVIPGSAFSKDQWSNIRRTGAVQAAGKVFPSPKVYGSEGEECEPIPEEKWTPGMRNIAEYAEELGYKVLKVTVKARFENRFGAMDIANYGRGGHLCFNVARLGKAWFDQGPTEAVNDLLIHEFAHEYGAHLTDEFDHGLSRIGAAMVRMAMNDPAFFRKYGFK